MSSNSVNLSYAAIDLYPSTKRSMMDPNSVQMATTGFSYVIPDGIPETGFNGVTSGACGGGLNHYCYGKNGYDEYGNASVCSHMWVG